MWNVVTLWGQDYHNVGRRLVHNVGKRCLLQRGQASHHNVGKRLIKMGAGVTIMQRAVRIA